jgi:hypothetical protein
MHESVQKLIHLRSLNVRHFGMVEALSLSNMEMMSTSR